MSAAEDSSKEQQQHLQVLASSNPFYNDLVEVMKTPCFQSFCAKYMSHWSDVETTMLYVKVYELLDKFMGENAGREADVLAVLDKIMNDGPSRRRVVEMFRNYQKDHASLEQVWKRTTTQHSPQQLLKEK